MHPAAANHIRIARPSRSLDRAERFWVDGLGLEVLYRAEPHADGEHSLLMLGWTDASWHLELVADPQRTPNPTDEDLLVLYVGDRLDQDDIARLVAAGGRLVPAHNPYWDRWGVTIADPDGYRLVLSHRSWP